MPEPGRDPYGVRGQKEKSKKRWLLIPLLLVFASITSFLAGTHVGRSTDQHLGQMLDTIILSPDAGQADKNRIEFSGQVLYTDGTPCSNQKIELHSDPMRTTTDSEGFFHFPDVEIGEHQLFILDENDRPASEMKVKIERDQKVKAGQIRGTVGFCQLSVAENVIRIHVQLRLDDSNTLSIEPEVYTKDQNGFCMDSDGREVSPSILDKSMGVTRQQTKQEPPVSGENMMDPENADAGTNVSGTGPLRAKTEAGMPGAGSGPALETSSGTSDTGSAPIPGISPGTGDAGSTDASTDTVPGTSGSGNSGGGDSGNSGGGGGSGTKPNPTDPNPTDPTASEPSPTDPVPTSPGETDPRPTKPQPTEPTSTEPVPTEPEPAEPLNVSVQEKAGPVWTQQTVISLFANRTGAGSSRKLMPGSKGSYEFLVSNQNSYGITYKMELSAPEGQLLLPLRYRLKSGGTYLCGSSKNWLDAGELSAASVTLPSGEEKEYLLEWQWMFEGGDDDLDTRIGSAEHLEYEVIVTIRIEQLIV